MRWVIAVFITTVLATAAAGLSVAVWDGRIGHRDPALRAIHYDNLDASSQRRTPPHNNSLQR